MPPRTGEAQTKAVIVLKCGKGKPGADICAAHRICQSLDARCREQCLANAAKALNDPQRTRK